MIREITTVTQNPELQADQEKRVVKLNMSSASKDMEEEASTGGL